MSIGKNIGELERLYERFNRRELAAGPKGDPISFLYEYPDPEDREIVAVVASSLAYGRVAQILASVRKVLGRLEGRPAKRARDFSRRRLCALMGGFKHRFTTGEELAALLAEAGAIRRKRGSLERCFLDGIEAGAEDYLPALTHFCESLRGACGGAVGKFLLPTPAKGSACKRVNLMLRWLVRRDKVDPGGWDGVQTWGLLIPLDTHMHRICRGELGMTRRNAADLRTVLEVTAAFRKLCPHDPVRYDFALTRRAIMGNK